MLTKKQIKKVFSFKGRMRRSHYALSILASYAIIALVVFSSIMAESNRDLEFLNIVCLLLIPVAIWIILAAKIKRCHDRGNSGWWLLYTAIPYIGTIFLLILLFGNGDIDENKYGPNPRNN